MLTAIGVKTQIWNNQVKSVILLAGFPCLLLVMTWLFFVLLADNQPLLFQAWLKIYPVSLMQAGWEGLRQYWPLPIFIALGWYFIAAIFYQPLLNGLTGAREVSRKEEPKLYNLLENLCISRGLPVPNLYIIETDALNAYASGLSPKAISVTVTRALVDTLNDAELEAVLGHEVTHIMNNDVQLVMIGVIFAGMLTLLCDLFYEMFRFARPSSSGDSQSLAIPMLIALAVFSVGRIFALGIRFALSRDREFMADAGSVELTKNPDALISALKKIAANPELTGVSGEIAQMCIEDANDDSVTWFSTHPSMHDRIQALVMMGGHDTPLPVAATSAATSEKPWLHGVGPWSEP